MRVFILEDSAPRMVWFHQSFIGCQLDWAFTVEQGIKLLEKNEYDVIFLDHDLCDAHYMYILEGKELTTELLATTGRTVARWIGEHPEKSTGAHIVLHSMNNAGCLVMQSYLKGRKVDIVPYDQLKKRLKVPR